MSFRYRCWIIAGAALLATVACEPDKSAKRSDPPPQAVAPTITSPVAQSPEPKIQEKLVPKVDPVEAIITQTEQAFREGEANYQAGHLDQAKTDFDRAFNVLLSYPKGVKSDDRLSDEFDKIVEAVNELEMQALKQGDGFTAQAAEPAPIDEANQVTFPVDESIKATAQAELKGTQLQSDLPLVMNDYVAGYINYFSTRGKGFLENGLVRAGRYEPMIRRVLKEEGVPQDLIYLAQAESGFHPIALSHAGARGMWQFMAGRAAGYGLERNWWVDDRQDPEKATRAAARHLKDLYKQFGDWYLAMAAYNSGPGNVQQAVQRTGYADFWELYKRNVLPAETKNYVPIILAVTIMAKNPAQYGLQNLQPDPPLKYDKVTVDYPVDLRLVAEITGSSVSTIQDLNPALLRMTTPREGTYDLKLPVGTSDRFQQVVASIPRDMRVWWRYHKVGSGETIASIAHQYRTTASSIAEANSIDSSDDLQAGTSLVIPVTPGRNTERVAYSKHPTIYKVRRGDTVLTVADDFGVPVAKLRSWNRLRGNALAPGRLLHIYRPIAAPELAEARSTSRSSSHKSSSKSSLRVRARTVHHKVRRGETLSSIAESYNTTVAALRRDNRSNASPLRVGTVLVVHTGE